MNRVTQQRVAPVVTTIEVLVVLDALVFLIAALLHAGLQVPLGGTVLSEPFIPGAAIIEGASALLFLISATALFTRKTWAWSLTLAAHVFALVGVLVGIFALAMGLSPFTQTNDLLNRIMLLLILPGLALLLSPGGQPIPFTRMMVRVTGTTQLILGLTFWISDNDAVVPTHIQIGSVLILTLWALAFLSARAGASTGLVALVLVWGLLIPVIGIAQVNILVGPYHWVIQVFHLLFSMIGIGLGERLYTSVRDKENQPLQSV